MSKSFRSRLSAGYFLAAFLFFASAFLLVADGGNFWLDSCHYDADGAAMDSCGSPLLASLGQRDDGRTLLVPVSPSVATVPERSEPDVPRPSSRLAERRTRRPSVALISPQLSPRAPPCA